MRIARLLLAWALLALPWAAAGEPSRGPSVAMALDPSDRAYLQQHPVLRLGIDSNRPPVEYLDQNGEYSGIVSDYMRELERRLGIRFELVHKANRAETVQAFIRGDIDVMSAIGRSPLVPGMQLTKTYLQLANGIIVRDSEPFVENLDDIAAGKRLAVVRGYVSSEKAASNHPQLIPIPVNTVEEALFAVSTQRADVAVMLLASAHHISQLRGFTNLRVASSFDESPAGLNMGVQPSLAPLAAIFDRALASIPDTERQRIQSDWLRLDSKPMITREAALYAACATALVMLGLLGWIIRLLRLARERERQRLRAEQAERQLHLIVGATPALFWLLRIEPGRSPRFERLGGGQQTLAGIDLAELGHSFSSVTRFMPPEDARHFRTLLEMQDPPAQGISFEHRLLHPSFGQRWFLVHLLPRHERSTLLWYGSTLDITERKRLEIALADSRRMLEELATGMPGAIWQIRREAGGAQCYSYLSAGAEELTGFAREASNQVLMAKTAANVHPDDRAAITDWMRAFFTAPVVGQLRYRLQTATGDWKWVDSIGRSTAPDADGTVLINGVTLDATRLHETEQALAHERRRLQDLTDNFDGALWHLKRHGPQDFRFDYISEGCVKITGRSAADVISRQINPLTKVVPGEREQLLAALDESERSGKPLVQEYTLIAEDGRHKRVLTRAIPRRDADGLPTWTGVILDVSERLALTQALSIAHQRLEDVAANLPGAIFQLRLEANQAPRLTYISEGIRTLMGHWPGGTEEQERSIHFVAVHEDDRLRVQTELQQAAAASSSVQFDFRLLHRDGQQRWMHCAATARRQADGSSLINGLLLDAERNKRLEGELRTAQAAAEAASAAKGRFLAHMSHEIRTPMNAVIGLSQLALQKASDPAQAERLGKIHRAGKGLLKLLNDILEYSRLEAGKVEPVLAPFDLDALLDHLRLFCADAAEVKGLRLRIEREAPLATGWIGDATRIQQILLNLMSNAIKFTDAGHVALQVTAARQGEGLRFCIEDSGSGLTPEQQGRVFEAFEQASSSTQLRHGGSGLGLSITRELVGVLGGHLRVDSTPGRGSTFTVELPLRAARPGAASAAASAAGLMPQRLRVADAVARRELQAALTETRVLRGLLAADGREAELLPLERLLTQYDFEAAEIELARLGARWKA